MRKVHQTKEDISEAINNCMKKTLDVGRTSIANNEQYEGFRKLIMDHFNDTNRTITKTLDDSGLFDKK